MLGPILMPVQHHRLNIKLVSPHLVIGHVHASVNAPPAASMGLLATRAGVHLHGGLQIAEIQVSSPAADSWLQVGLSIRGSGQDNLTEAPGPSPCWRASPRRRGRRRPCGRSGCVHEGTMGPGELTQLG